MRLDVWQSLHSDLTPGVQGDQQTWAAPLGTRQLLLPIRTLPDGARGVSSLIFNQASFEVQDAISDGLTVALRPFAPDVIVAVPTLGLPLGEAVARRLGHSRFVPLSTSRKFWFDEALSVPIRSITSPDQSKRLYVDPRLLPLLQGRVAVIDDVLSSGQSMAATLKLMQLIDVSPVAIGCAMLQGESWRSATADIPTCHAITTPILTKTPEGWRA